VTTTTQVVVGENENGESAIRRFRKAVMSSGHIQEVRALATTTTTTRRRRRR
jgi:ribosomal protein S21